MFKVLLLFLGLIIGNMLYDIVIRKHMLVRKKPYGTIFIDHNTYYSRIRIDSDEKLLDRRTKYILFKVDHNAIISREDHVL